MKGNTVKLNRFGIGSVLTGLAAAVAIAAAPSAAAVGLDPVSAAGETQPTQAPPAPGAPSRGTVALPPGGQIDILPQDQILGGADPLVPFGTDPFVPPGVRTP